MMKLIEVGMKINRIFGIDDFLGFKIEEITPDMGIEDFIKIGERMKMREELAKSTGTFKKEKSKANSKNISEKDVMFIQKEFQKDVLNRDWTRLYEILNHIKNLSTSLIVHEMKIS